MARHGDGPQRAITTNDSDMFSSSIGPETTMQVIGSPEDRYHASVDLGVRA